MSTDIDHRTPTADPELGKHTVASPCRDCPFLAKFDTPGGREFLRPGRRAEFINGMLAGGADFPCHKTAELVEADDGETTDGFVAGPDSLACAGARLVLLRAERSSNMMRVEERLGLFDPEAFLDRNRRADVWTYGAIVDETDEDDEIETCEVVGLGCEAPAGFVVGDGVQRGTVAAEYYCWSCGLAVCGACSEDHPDRPGERLCADCGEDDE